MFATFQLATLLIATLFGAEKEQLNQLLPTATKSSISQSDDVYLNAFDVDEPSLQTVGRIA